MGGEYLNNKDYIILFIELGISILKFSIVPFLLAENNADIAIQQLLALNREPQAQLLEQEQQEEVRLIAAVNRYNETLRTDDVLAAMHDILAQETQKFKQFDQSRVEATQSILAR